LEVFLVPVAVFVGLEFAKWACKKLFDTSFEKLTTVLSDQWTQLIDPEGGWRIVRVAVRTEDKGVMELPFSKFRTSFIYLTRPWPTHPRP
jgi:hypothetical protein